MYTFIPTTSFLSTFHSRHAQSTSTRTTRLIQTASHTRCALDALLFDCDGVLADTERDAHRVAFNLAFSERSLNTNWDESLYGELLATGGGKERMTAYWNSQNLWPDGITDPEQQQQLVKELHARKTELFMQLVSDGKIPLRDGVKRLVSEARDAGVPVAVCSTSNEKAVQKIVGLLGVLGDDVKVFAGDVVKKKKPSPDIYLLAAEVLGVDCAKVCVIEDSFIGLQAALKAGMKCVVTKSTYTRDEDFQGAQLVVESLEEPTVSLDMLTKLVEGNSKTGRAVMPQPGFRRRRRFGSSYL